MTLPDGTLLPGSDARLGEALAKIRSFAPRADGNRYGRRLDRTDADRHRRTHRFGRLLVATTGNAFHAEDWASLLQSFAPVVLPIYGPVIVGALVLIPLTVRMVEGPLRRLSAEASLIAPGSLELRLGEEGLGVDCKRWRERSTRRSRASNGDRQAAALCGERCARASHTDRHSEPARRSAAKNPDLKSQVQVDIARVQTLVEQLVTVARLGQNHVSMDEPIDVVRLLRDAVADRAPIAFRAGREIELEAEPDAFLIRGNRQALFSALANVIDNAIRAEPPGGVVAVRLGSPTAWRRSSTTARKSRPKTGRWRSSPSGGARRKVQAPDSASPSSRKSPTATMCPSSFARRPAEARPFVSRSAP